MNKRHNLRDLTIILLFVVTIVIIVAIVVLNLVIQQEADLKKLLIDLLNDVLSAIVIGLFVGMLVKVFTDKPFSIKVDYRIMKKAGISNIGNGISNKDDINKMFGSDILEKNYPRQLKLLFLTGNVFLTFFKTDIIRCIKNGCEVQLLLASYDKNNLPYLERISKLYHDSKVDYEAELREDALKTVDEILQETIGMAGSLKVRFYRDEYQNNIRVAKYIDQPPHHTDISYYWINLQPLTLPAKTLSLALKGFIESDTEDEESDDEKNLCKQSEKGFNLLWDIYKETEYKEGDRMLKASSTNEEC
ncbi:MAG: hypothetical protein J1F65_03275 [Clostridiales bacterium]|nr:hypothetical protein [Clostridiales bacterium]